MSIKSPRPSLTADAVSGGGGGGALHGAEDASADLPDGVGGAGLAVQGQSWKEGRGDKQGRIRSSERRQLEAVVCKIIDGVASLQIANVEVRSIQK